jgi:hypothetical protein
MPGTRFAGNSETVIAKSEPFSDKFEEDDNEKYGSRFPLAHSSPRCASNGADARLILL